MKKLNILLLLIMTSFVIISCSKDEITNAEVNTDIKQTENTLKSKARAGIYYQGATQICDRLGPRLEIELQYLGPFYFDVLVYVDLFEADGVTLIETYEVNNYNDLITHYFTIGNGFNHKCCSLLDPGTDYKVKIRYSNNSDDIPNVISPLYPVSTEPDCFCTLGGIIG